MTINNTAAINTDTVKRKTGIDLLYTVKLMEVMGQSKMETVEACGYFLSDGRPASTEFLSEYTRALETYRSFLNA